MKQNTHIEELYSILKDMDFEGFGDFYLNVRDGKYTFDMCDIILLCEIFIQDFEDLQPNQIGQVVKMTLFTVDKYDLNLALMEMVKGIKKIYIKGIQEEKKSKRGNEYDEFIYEYISMFINSYEDTAVAVFGEIINSDDCIGFKMKIKEIVEESMEYEVDEYLIKGNILLDNIKI